jgi:thiosulfate dehydrogenase
VRFALFALLLVAGCDDPVARGQRLFADPAVSGSGANVLTCALCHDATPTRADSSGAPLEGVFLRPSFWGGDVLDPLSATNVCVTAFMGGRGLQRGVADADALSAYLESISDVKKVPGDLTLAQPYTVPATISADTVAALPPGDATAGAARWKSACMECHGDAGTGKGRISSETSVVPNSIIDGVNFPDSSVWRTVIVEKIRHGKFFGIGGKMAPFSLERLPDQAVADLLAFMEAFGLPPRP